MGGKNLRRRSSVMVNRDLLIDLGPDSIQAMLALGFDPSLVRYLFQTHPHHDHFDQNHLMTRMPEYGGRWDEPLHLVASGGTLRRMTTMLHGTGFEGDLLNGETQRQLSIAVQPVQAGETIQPGEYWITALNANHDRGAECLIYAIQQQESSLLYATDTDTLPEPTFDLLQNFSFSTVILDHTYGPGCDGGGHLNAGRFQTTIQRLKTAGMLRESARIYATHLSHEGNMEHEELSRYAVQHGYLIPWDGLSISV